MLSALSSQHPAERLLVLALDVTQPDAIAGAFSHALSVFGRIDVVFNNAGYALVSEVEGARGREADVRALFEVNFWGALRVSQEAVRVFREENAPRGGRLLQVSSTAALDGAPAVGFYGASKAGARCLLPSAGCVSDMCCVAGTAFESVSEALAKELDPAWNIKARPFSVGCPRNSC